MKLFTLVRVLPQASGSDSPFPVLQMFEVLSFTVPTGCNDAPFCPPSQNLHSQLAEYRVTPASGDPYKYIRSGNYAKILCRIGGVEGEIDCGKKKAKK